MMRRKDFDADCVVTMLLDIACQISYAYLGESAGEEDLHDKIHLMFRKCKKFVDATDEFNKCSMDKREEQ